jgi:hypothetical protein
MHGVAVWKDSNGTIVPVVRLVGDPTQNAAAIVYEFVDAATGSIWMWNGWKNQTETEWAGVTIYNIGSCMGTPYILAQLPPRYAVTVTGMSGFYMMPDTTLPTQIGVLSSGNPSSCQAQGGYTTYAVPTSSLVKLSITAPPLPPGVPPYHPEMM